MLQYFDGCPHWQTMQGRLEQALVGREDVRVELQRVDSPDAARRLGFHGSPSLLVDGRDSFAGPDTQVGLACRVYQAPDGPAGSPTVGRLRKALEEASETEAAGV